MQARTKDFFSWISLLLATVLLLSSCGTAELARSTQVQLITSSPGTVAVIADPYLVDTGEADRLAKLVRQEMDRCGFRTTDAVHDADSIVIPSLGKRSGSAGAARSETEPASPPLLNQYGTEPGMLRAPVLERLRTSDAGSTNNPAAPALVLTAINRAEWEKALIVDQLQTARLWRIVVYGAHADKTGEPGALAALVARAEDALRQIAKRSDQISARKLTEQPTVTSVVKN